MHKILVFILVMLGSALALSAQVNEESQSSMVSHPEHTVRSATVDPEDVAFKNLQPSNETVITDKKKHSGRETDRLIFYTENSSAGDALEVLRAIPGIRVQGNRITMTGNRKVSIMVNDKIIPFSTAENLMSFLRSIAAETIESIELITTPSAKYEVPGTHGIVNIQLKEEAEKERSWNALLKSSYLQRYRELGSFGGSFNYNDNKLSIGSSVNYESGFYLQSQNDYTYFSDGLWYNHSPFVSDLKSLNARLNMSYEIMPGWTMGAQYSYNRVHTIFTYTPNLQVFDYETNAIIRSAQTSEGISDKIITFHNINYNNEIAIDTLGRKVSLYLDYFTYRRPDRKTYRGTSVIEAPFSEQYYLGINNNIQDITNISGKLDVEYPTKWANLNFGGKISRIKALNQISSFNSGLMDAPITEFPLEENDFERIENNQFAYFLVDKKINEKWNAKLGLRMEALQITSTSNTLETENDYTRLLPSIHIAHRPNENATLTLSYSKSIENITFFPLSPNIYFSHPFQGARGNPFLQPAFIDNAEFVYTYKNLESKIYYSYADNMYGQLFLPNPATNFVDVTYRNYMNTQRFGIAESYVFDKVDWWTSSNSVDVNYTISKFDLPQEEEDQKGFNAIISTNNDFILNADKTLLLNLGYWYSFDGVGDIFDVEAMSSLSLSLQLLLLNKNLNITLAGTDLFRGENDIFALTVNGVYQEGRYYYDSRSFRLSVSYSFGNKNLKTKTHKSGNQRERGRSGY